MVETMLTLIWAGIIGFAVFMYVLMDGFDLGVGIVFPFVPSDHDRDVMMNSVAPVWDFNETWLVLGGAGLFAAFPLAYAVLLPALYMPLLVMLLALIFRGVAFEFRFKARNKDLWDVAFFLGSVLATFAQGIVLGTFIQGFPVENRAYVGGMFDWATPFACMVGIGLLCGYGLLGTTWLVWRTEGALQDWMRTRARWFLVAVLGFVALVSLWTPLEEARIAERWFSWPNMLLLSPVPVATAGAAFLLWRGLNKKAEVAPFVLSMTLFALSYLGLAISLWPHLIPPEITLWQAAAPPETQLFLLVGMMFLIPTILAYTAYCYWVFRGKVTAESHYH
jgi:cytochrome d ubiquinol oxidase subunit II